jgi:signal transduction histidine kinase
MNPTGTGLGLSICKQMIEQMGGIVSVNSKVGKGTCFSFDIKTKSKKKVLSSE